MTSSCIAFSKELNYTRYRAIRRDVKSERFRMLLALKTLKTLKCLLHIGSEKSISVCYIMVRWIIDKKIIIISLLGWGGIEKVFGVGLSL